MKWLELLGKRLLRGSLRMLLSAKERDPGEAIPENVRKILVVRQDNRIGNLVLQIPFITALKHTFPHATITVLLGGTFAELYRYVPEIDNLIVFPHRELARHPWRWLSFVRHLGKGGWDLAFECGHPHVVSLNNASLGYLSRVPFRVGFRRGDSDIFLNVLCNAPTQHHYAEVLKHLLAPWGDVGEVFPMALPLPDVHRDAWRRLWDRADLDVEARVVLLWSGGRYGKRWPVSFITSIADSISRNIGDPWVPVIGVGPGEEDLESEFSELADAKIIRFDGPVEELWAFMDRCQAVISGDTGPMHLAAALGVPTFALFRVDNVWEYGHDDGEQHRAMVMTDTNQVHAIIDFLKTLPEDSCPRSTICY